MLLWTTGPIWSLVWFVLGTTYCSHRWQLLQFIATPVFFGILLAVPLSFVWMFMDWKRVGWRSAPPFFLCLVSLIGSLALALTIRERIFEWSLPSHEAVVHHMEAGNIPVPTNKLPALISIPSTLRQPRLAHSVAACRDTNGVLIVEILTEGGFPVSHSGYLVSSSGSITPGSDADGFYRARRQVRPQWFYITY
jgi:hypothetical protein